MTRKPSKMTRTGLSIRMLPHKPPSLLYVVTKVEVSATKRAPTCHTRLSQSSSGPLSAGWVPVRMAQPVEKGYYTDRVLRFVNGRDM